MKGCLDSIFKLIVFFVVFLIFCSSIYSFILPDAPLSLEKDRRLLTGKETIEIQKFHNEMRYHMTYAQFLAFPPTILTTYLIFRKKKKG